MSKLLGRYPRVVLFVTFTAFLLASEAGRKWC